MKKFESWLLKCQLKAEKMNVSRTCSNVQAAHITLRVQCIGHFQKKECWLIHVQLYSAWQEGCQVGFIKVNITSRPTVPIAKSPGLEAQPIFCASSEAPPGSNLANPASSTPLRATDLTG